MTEKMTAAGLYELVREWPEEARPEGVYHHADVVTPTLGPDAGKEVTNHQWKTHRGECGLDCYDQCHIFDLPHAIALHEASGLKWLVRHYAAKGYNVIVRLGDDYALIEVTDHDGLLTNAGGYGGREPIHAIDAAIRATT